MGNFVDFSFHKQGIKLSLALEGRIKEWVGQDFFINGSLAGDVDYQKDGTFQVSNVHLEWDND